MKLIGVYEAWTSEKYVPMADLTVILGANDVGKTRILFGIYDFARFFIDPESLETVPESLAYFEVSDVELSGLIYLQRESLLRKDVEPGRLYANLLDHPVTDGDILREEISRMETNSLGDWLRAMSRAIGKERELEDGIGKLEGSNVLGASCEVDQSGAKRKDLWVCLPEREGDHSPGFGVSLKWVSAPIEESMPAPLILPQEWDALASSFESSVSSVLRILKVADSDSAEWDRERSSPEFEFNRLWVDESTDGMGLNINPHAHRICELVSAVATNSLPGFIGKSYRVNVSLGPMSSWARTPGLNYQLDWGGHPIELSDIAEGLKLWVQMAILDAALLVGKIESLVIQALASDPDSRYDLDTVRELFDRVMRFVDHPEDPETDSEEMSAIAMGLRSFKGVMTSRGRTLSNLYILDEPERHLNPKLVREAAEWLEKFVGHRSAQALIATHSPAFLSLGIGTAYNYAWREGDAEGLDPIDAEELGAMDHISSELGFDRGELLSSVRMFLFVEGRADQIVLERLFRRDLRELGIEVVPVHGVFKFSGVIGAEVLWKFTAADIAVLVDNDIAREVEEIRTDAAKRRAAMSQRKTELQQVANLLETAVQAEREVCIRSISTFDMFGLLDEGILKSMFPLFPGHEVAESEWREATEIKANSRIGRKAHLSSAYGIEVNNGLFEEITSRMVDQKIRPLELKELMASLSQVLDPS